MKSIFSRKTIGAIVASTVSTLLVAGFSTQAFADNKSALKDAIGIEVAEAKPSEIKAAEAKPADPMAKAPTDADFKKLDGNSDGKISLKEAVKDKSLATAFDATDANHDGMIAADEYANYKAASAIKGTDPSAVTPVTN